MPLAKHQEVISPLAVRQRSPCLALGLGCQKARPTQWNQHELQADTAARMFRSYPLHLDCSLRPPRTPMSGRSAAAVDGRLGELGRLDSAKRGEPRWMNNQRRARHCLAAPLRARTAKYTNVSAHVVGDTRICLLGPSDFRKFVKRRVEDVGKCEDKSCRRRGGTTT